MRRMVSSAGGNKLDPLEIFMSLIISPPRAIRNCFLSVVSLFIIVNIATAQQSQPAGPGSAARRVGRPFPPPQYIPPHDYDQRNIKLDLRFDWDQEQAIGTETITLAPTVANLRRIDLDAAFMAFSNVTLAAGAPLKFEYDTTKEKLSIFLDRAYQPAD